MLEESLSFHKIEIQDCQDISHAFTEQGWDKPLEQYQRYLRLQKEGSRDIIIAKVNNTFAGYLTIQWTSNYPPFKEKNIPEVVDFNVLKKFQRKGIGSALMQEAEDRIKKVSEYAGIGFGVTKDYGAAQILYIKRNYIPDGNGLCRNSTSLNYGEQVSIDHDLVFHLIKKL